MIERLRSAQWRIDYALRVPRYCDLDLRLGDGNITIKGVEGVVNFNGRRGEVRLEHLGGTVYGAMGEGAAEIVLSERSWRGRGLDLSLGRGEIRLRVPEVYNAELAASAGAEAIDVRYPLGAREASGARSLHTNIGSGGALISLTSVAGKVRVLPLVDAP
jgi:hypothetical protein